MKDRIREALQFQDLTEEEKQRRGILARLYGPCASVISATRNGRKYSDELWEKVFNENEIVKEMFENGGCPMELDHPVDREETCSEKIAAMLPEPPKRDQDGHLICYIDLIDTPCGNIAYKLAKYGFKLGISSRGSGDLYTDDEGNESVDPETYDFTTFDLVLLPAVKDARLKMCESVDSKLVKLKADLAESYNKASATDKQIMTDTLNKLNLGINLTEAKKEAETDKEEKAETKEFNIEESTVKDLTNSLNDVLDYLENFDDSTEVQYDDIIVNGNVMQIDHVDIEDIDDKIHISIIGYDADNSANIDSDESEQKSLEATEADVLNDEDDSNKAGEAVEEADDDGSNLLIDSLKEAIRQKEQLAKENEKLKADKAVGDAKVEKLDESVKRYKESFERVSEVASKSLRLQKQVDTLTERLEQSEHSLKTLRESKAQESVKISKLTENINAHSTEVKSLKEALWTAQDTLEKKSAEFNEKLAKYDKELANRQAMTKQYKGKLDEVFTKYVHLKASMLGVNPAEITSKLSENYSIENVDSVCETLLESNSGFNKFPMYINSATKVKFSETPSKNKAPSNPSEGYEIDDSLLELAGLK